MNWIILNSNLKLKYIAKKICATTNYLLWKIFRKKETIEKTFDKSKVKNILVINLAYLGDVLVTLPMDKISIERQKYRYINKSAKRKIFE